MPSEKEVNLLRLSLIKRPIENQVSLAISFGFIV